MKILKFLLLIALGSILLIAIAYFTLDHFQEPYKLDKKNRNKAQGSFIDLSMGKTHYQFHGSEKGDLIVLIHGGGATGCYAWIKTIPALVDAGYRVLCYDLYGRGYSDSPDTTYDPELIYNQLVELLDSLHIQDPFHLFGQSMGAMPATRFAAQFPERVKRLIYIAPAALGGFSDKWYFGTPLLSDLLMTFYWYPQSLSSQMAEFYHPEKAKEYENVLAHFMKFKGYKAVNLSTWRNTYTVNMEKELKAVGDNGTEVLLIMGKADPYIPYQSKEHYKAAIPNLSTHIIEEAGHMPHYEKPKIVNTIILDFLNKKISDLKDESVSVGKIEAETNLR